MNIGFSQNFEGKWILAKNGDTYSSPKVNVLDFKNDKVTFSDLEKINEICDYKIIANEIFINGLFFGNFKFIAENRFTLYKIEKNDPKQNLEIDFVKLQPTKTNLTKSEIQNLTFENKDYKLKIAFNIELQKKDMLEILKENGSQKMLLKKADGVYFIYSYEGKYLNIIIPVKEITPDFIEIYGFSRKEPYTIIANKI